MARLHCMAAVRMAVGITMLLVPLSHQPNLLSVVAALSVSVCPGTVLDAPAAAVYQLSKGGQVVGVAISSEAAE